MPVKLNSSGGGSVTLTTPSTATDYTATFPAATGSVVLSNTSGTATVTDFYATNVYASGTVQMGSSFKRNRIINGDMRIDQRNAGAVVTPTISATGYATDRWALNISQNSKLTAQQSTAGGFTDFTNSLLITSSSAYAVVAGDYFMVDQNIEGLNVSDFNWGSANAKSVTLSFKVKSSLTGTFGGSLQNSNADRSYPFSYTISSANTETSISLTIPGDTTGTWLTTNGVGIRVRFSMGVGSTYTGPANTWAGATYLAPTGATSVVGTNGATFYITGVQLEVGSVATPYERQIYSDQLIECQRYYQKSYAVGTTPGTATTTGGVSLQVGTTTNPMYAYVVLRPSMRAAPDISVWDNAGNAGRVYKGAANKAGGAIYTTNGGFNGGTADATSAAELFFQWVASSEL